MKKLTGFLLIFALLLPLCACGDKNAADSEGDVPEGTAVEVVTVSASSVSTDSTVSGSISTDDSTSVFVFSSAKCTEVYFNAGDSVSRGDKLCRLEIDSDLSTYSAASISYESAVNSYNTQKELLDKQIALAEKTWHDTEALLKIGAASKLEVDSAELAYLSAKAQGDSALDQLRAGIKNAEAGLSKLNSALENVDADGFVIAPCSGTLSSINATAGGYISSASPVAVIDGAQQMKITVSVSETLAPKLSIGDAVTVKVASAGIEFESVIRSVDRTANAMTKLYSVTVSVPADTEGLIDGMFADVTFHTNISENTVTVPSEAILTSGDDRYVYTVCDGAAVYVPVETGLTDSGVTEIISGLDVGEQLVTVGQQYLSDGDPVRIVAAEE